LQSAQLLFTLPCGQGLHRAHQRFTLPCEHRFFPIVCGRAPRQTFARTRLRARAEWRRRFTRQMNVVAFRLLDLQKKAVSFR
jgi:hypothetical protein